MTELKEALNSNPYLTDEVKNDMNSNLEVLFNAFPNIDIDLIGVILLVR